MRASGSAPGANQAQVIGHTVKDALCEPLTGTPEARSRCNRRGWSWSNEAQLQMRAFQRTCQTTIHACRQLQISAFQLGGLPGNGSTGPRAGEHECHMEFKAGEHGVPWGPVLVGSIQVNKDQMHGVRLPPTTTCRAGRGVGPPPLYLYVCMYACVYACVHICMYACMQSGSLSWPVATLHPPAAGKGHRHAGHDGVRLHACMHVCVHACMNAYIHTYTIIHVPVHACGHL